MIWSWRGTKSAIFPERTPLFAAAPIQQVTEDKIRHARYPLLGALRKEQTPVSIGHSEPGDLCSFRKPNLLDKITMVGGSKATFISTLFLVQLWALSGFFYGFNDTWQILFQNASSIQVYITDILLIRQQQNTSRALLIKIAELQSRTQTFERLLTHIDTFSPAENDSKLEKLDYQTILVKTSETASKPSRIEKIWNSACIYLAYGLGSVWSFLIYWIGIGIWAALGPFLKYNNTWQLYINTATALLLTFTSVFLQNVQQGQEEKLAKSLENITKTDVLVEKNLRYLTGDQTPNPICTIPVATRSFTECQIDNFADIMGSGLGIIISIIFTIVWISFGPLLKFQDNWWLIIGTFTGLIGFIDGFVLRSLYHREEQHAKTQLDDLAMKNNRILTKLRLQNCHPLMPKISLADRISLTISNVCGHRYASVFAVGTVVGLLATASGMGWTETGQLICNTSTMIIEGFLLLVLIQAHNTIYQEREAEFNCLKEVKETLETYVSTL